MSHNEEKNQSIEAVPEITQMIDLVDKDTKIVIIILFYMSRKLEERLSMLSENTENVGTPPTHTPKSNC